MKNKWITDGRTDGRTDDRGNGLHLQLTSEPHEMRNKHYSGLALFSLHR